ncbi:MAG TPA: TadE/TadG family type IV pilus assembly protein [Mesorhizobium sp.]|jgi:Flp pilus assembly protein TadG|nr:TadE/TadG family type IV pilus assembly protein [Mesorhizobium sp.]
MFLNFLRDRSGGYAIMTAIMMVPLLGGLAIAIDYAEMSRERQTMLNALDAAGIATARRLTEGATETQAKDYAKDFFASNLNASGLEMATLDVTLPDNAAGIATLKLCANHTYAPYFYPAFYTLLTGGTSGTFPFSACTEVRMKNTMEVALVLDNSGSMLEIGKGSSKVRFDLLKEAAKQLVDTIAAEAAGMKQVSKPVQFGVVPFAASVNVGSGNANAAWMDVDGISPVHHENFDWGSFSKGNRKIEKQGSSYVKKGSNWGGEVNKKVTRFTLFGELKLDSGASFASWGGCVEARPHPYNSSDETPTSGTPATLFVPMFAPDEPDLEDQWGRRGYNNWWSDSMNGNGNHKKRQEDTNKYFEKAPAGVSAMGMGNGPNLSCTTKPITPLTDVSAAAGVAKVKKAIDDMVAEGATNVPEGMAWGWRAVSSKAPFTEGRSEAERGNDKVVIVLTDGANTYYTPGSVMAPAYSGGSYSWGGNDLAERRSIYSAYGYPGVPYAGGDTKLFRGTSTAVSRSDYSNANYGKAMNEHFTQLCGNAKAGNVIVMTVALDLDEAKAAEKTQIELLKSCASNSRFRKDANGQPAKLFWNATGGSLADKFKEIADELSNMRIVS